MLAVGDLETGEDIAQESFVKLHRHWASIESDAHATNFLYKVGLNMARSHLRSRRALERLLGRLASREALPRKADPDAVDRELVFTALRRMTARQRACLVLVDYAGFGSEDAGRALGLSASTVRVHLARGRARMRDLLGEPLAGGVPDERG